MTNKTQTYVFFGIVGSGKGTQVKLLEEYLHNNNLSEDIVFVSMGNKYRELIAKGNYTSSKAKDITDKGKLQPSFLTNSLFTDILINSLKEDSLIISDGFPRTVEQSVAFENAMNFYGRSGIHIVYIELSEQEAIKRMKLRGRSDDTDEGIANRLEEHKNKVVPSMNYFKNKEGYTIHPIKGDQSIEEVHKDIIKELGL